jgi:hypothetical protein
MSRDSITEVQVPPGVSTMKAIAERYRNQKTPKGHDLRVDEVGDGCIIWYLFWGEYRGVDDHHHMGIAKVRRSGEGYELGVLHGLQQEPDDYEAVQDFDALVARLDEEVARR